MRKKKALTTKTHSLYCVETDILDYVCSIVEYYPPSTFTPIGKRAFIFISPCSPRLSLILLLS